MTTLLVVLAAVAAWSYAGIVALLDRREQRKHDQWVAQHLVPARWAPKTLTGSETRHAA